MFWLNACVLQVIVGRFYVMVECMCWSSKKKVNACVGECLPKKSEQDVVVVVLYTDFREAQC